MPDGRGFGESTKKVKGLRNTKWWLQNSHGDVKYSIGNGVAKEHICMTHGQGIWGGDCRSEWGDWVEEVKAGKIGTTVIA